MTINIEKSQSDLGLDGQSPELVTKLTFNNGDKKALDKIVEEWDFKDEEAAIKFAMAVMLSAEKHELKIEESEGLQTYKPAENLLKQSLKDE